MVGGWLRKVLRALVLRDGYWRDSWSTADRTRLPAAHVTSLAGIGDAEDFLLDESHLPGRAAPRLGGVLRGDVVGKSPSAARPARAIIADRAPPGPSAPARRAPRPSLRPCPWRPGRRASSVPERGTDGRERSRPAARAKRRARGETVRPTTPRGYADLASSLGIARIDVGDAAGDDQALRLCQEEAAEPKGCISALRDTTACRSRAVRCAAPTRSAAPASTRR